MKRLLLRRMSFGALLSGIGILCTGFSCVPTPDEVAGDVVTQTGETDAGGNSGGDASDAEPADAEAGASDPTEAAGGNNPDSTPGDAASETGGDASANTGESGGDVTGSVSEGGTVTIDASGAITATYQPGVNGYASARSVAISTMYAENYNQYQGTLFTDDADTCIGDMPAHYYSESPLIRFEDLNIPANAQVLSATITFTFVSVYDGGGQRVTGHYLKVPWALSQGYGGSGVGWVYRDTGLAWGAPGARGEGSDIHAGKSFQSKALAEGPYQKDTIVLDTEIVQLWVSDPSQNFGIVLGVNIPDHHVGYRQPNNTHVEDRPILSITYTLPS